MFLGLNSFTTMSLPGLLSPPKCYNCFRVDISLGSRPLMPHYLGELMAFQGQTNILSDPPLHVGHGDADYFVIVCRFGVDVVSLR